MVWKYLDLVNECVKILLTVGIGYGTAYFGIIHATTFCPMATKFVFYVALPALIMKGLGIGIDLYDDNFSWTFIGVFLLLRALALGGAIVWSWVSTRSGVHPDNDIGQVAVHWLNLTWISTVILGIPISEAVFGSRALGNFYGIVRIRGQHRPQCQKEIIR
jgi:predicted permease